MIRNQWLTLMLCIGVLSACVSFQVSGDFQAGRQALLTNNDEQALGYFQRAAESDPNYIFTYDTFREGIWTYLGGAQYRLGRYEAARQSLERALATFREDHLAKIYLGLTLARLGAYAQGIEQIHNGLFDLYRWLEYMQAVRPYTSFWDPLRQIRSEIQKGLDLIAAERIDWPKLIDGAEWVARQMEEEVERVRRDERRLRDRDLGPRSGLGVGLGF